MKNIANLGYGVKWVVNKRKDVSSYNPTMNDLKHFHLLSSVNR